MVTPHEANTKVYRVSFWKLPIFPVCKYEIIPPNWRELHVLCELGLISLIKKKKETKKNKRKNDHFTQQALCLGSNYSTIPVSVWCMITDDVTGWRKWTVHLGDFCQNDGAWNTAHRCAPTTKPSEGHQPANRGGFTCGRFAFKKSQNVSFREHTLLILTWRNVTWI